MNALSLLCNLCSIIDSRKIKSIFITGTDTGVGKTVVTGLLGRYFIKQGYNVITQKWIQTGTKNYSRDINLHLRLMGRKKGDVKNYLRYLSCYTFRPAYSPHLAARLEKKRIDIEYIKKSFNFLQKEFDLVLVEGVGGVLVPLNSKKLVIDVAKELNLPVIVVAGNKLGAINHTLLTIEAMRNRRLDTIGIIFNNRYSHTDINILKDNLKIIKRLTGIPVIGTISYLKNIS